MQQPTVVVRHYHEADATMRQDMRTMHGHFAAHAAEFAAFNPEFAVPFATDWLAAIGLADTTPDHTVRTGELVEDTDAVETAMTQAQAAVQTLFYYVGRAFPHNVGRLTTYGRGDYEAARKQHDKMRSLLDKAFAAATLDKVALAAKGYTPAQLANLGTLESQLTDTNTTQGMKKGTNVEGTEHYLTVQNLAYGYGQEVSAAAKVRFAADAATLKLFRLGGPALAPHETHELTVAPGGLGSVRFDTPLGPATRLRLRLAVPQPGQAAAVGRTEAAGQTLATFVTLTPGISELNATAAELGPAGQWLEVASRGTQPVRVEIGVL